jgi:uncharacterized protein (TIGR02271 family)
MGHDQEQPRLRTFNGELRGKVVAIAQSATGLEVIICLDDGTQLHVPTAEPLDALGGTFYLPVNLAPPEMTITQVRSRTREDDTAARDRDASTEKDVLPVVSEELKVDKRAVETGTVRVSTRTREREETVDVPLRRDEVDIERVAVNKIVDAWVPVRMEGDATIIPVLEETLVVEKRLLLREEVRVRLKTREEHRPQRVRLRGEDVVVERIPAGKGHGEEHSRNT